MNDRQNTEQFMNSLLIGENKADESESDRSLFNIMDAVEAAAFVTYLPLRTGKRLQLTTILLIQLLFWILNMIC